MVSRKSYRKSRYSRKTNKKHRNRSLKKRKMARKTRKNRLKYVMKGGVKKRVTFYVDTHPITIEYESDEFPVGRDSPEKILMSRYRQLRQQSARGGASPENFVQWLAINQKTLGFQFRLVDSDVTSAA